MAGDWIKMRGNLWDDPRVARICDLTDQPEASIVGALYWLWASADQHTEDGVMPGLSIRQIDRKTGVAGFGQALCDVGWLEDHPEGVIIVRFDEHNGESAKRRSSESKRKMSARKADKARTDCGQIAEEDGTSCSTFAHLEKEKRREEVNLATESTSPVGFAEFWLGYPKKVGKGAAEKAFRRAKIGATLLPAILQAIERARATEQWRKDNGQFIPNPATWLNERRWEDEAATVARPANSLFAGVL